MTASAPVGSSTDHHMPMLEEIFETRDHLDPALLASAILGEDSLALAGTCLGLPFYARELDRTGGPKLWPFAGGYAEGRRHDELLLASAYLLVAYEEDLTEAGAPASRAMLTTQLLDARATLVGPDAGDPAKSRRASAADALAFAGACYALPPYARELGLHGVPLLWPWPRALYRTQRRGQDLGTAIAMFMAELERLDRNNRPRRPVLSVLPGGVGEK